jgi:hypothetical protein
LTTPADALVERLTGRFVVRYDLRDTGRSTTVDPDLPGYTLRDLVADAVGVLDGLGIARAHVAGLATGGLIAQLVALDHPSRVASLVIGTRPVAPGPVDDDLPEHSPHNGLMSTVFATGLHAAPARTAVGDHHTDTGGARRSRPVLPGRQRRALAAKMPSATLKILDGVGAELPRQAHAQVAAAVLAHTAP